MSNFAPSSIALKARCIMLVAGEASGDAHGAELISQLKAQNPNVRIIGAGGPRMAAYGQEQLFDLAKHAVIGLTDVLKNYFKFHRFFYRLISLANAERPDAVIFIDNPGFNLRLAKALQGLRPRTKMIYYIAPQVWAWKEHRAKEMAKHLDLVISIFPFEKKWFEEKQPNLRVEWVGHPLLDSLRLDNLGPAGDEARSNRIAILPGSRKTEQARHLPILWKATELFARGNPQLHFVFILANDDRVWEANDFIEKQPSPSFSYEITSSYALSHLSRCEMAMVKSGTGSLDCAFAGVPHLVVYQMSKLTYRAARAVVKLNHVSMVNILAKDPPIVPELLQDDFTPERVAREAYELLARPRRMAEMRADMREVIRSLGEPGASGRAATLIYNELAQLPEYTGAMPHIENNAYKYYYHDLPLSPSADVVPGGLIPRPRRRHAPRPVAVPSEEQAAFDDSEYEDEGEYYEEEAAYQPEGESEYQEGDENYLPVVEGEEEPLSPTVTGDFADFGAEDESGYHQPVAIDSGSPLWHEEQADTEDVETAEQTSEYEEPEHVGSAEYAQSEETLHPVQEEDEYATGHSITHESPPGSDRGAEESDRETPYREESSDDFFTEDDDLVEHEEPGPAGSEAAASEHFQVPQPLKSLPQLPSEEIAESPAQKVGAWLSNLTASAQKMASEALSGDKGKKDQSGDQNRR